MKYLVLAFTIFLLASCDPKPKAETSSVVDTTSNLDNARTITVIKKLKSTDYQGTYKGTLPCADCMGIRMEIDLRKDSTYQLKTTYLGKGDEKPTLKEGTYSWSKADSLITLTGVTDQPNKYQVGTNSISQLDMDGTKVLGPSAKRYILRK